MHQKTICAVRLLAALALAGSACLFVLPAHADFERSLKLASDAVVVRNLIGRIDVVGHAGSDFEIEVRVRGEDATPDRIEIATDEGRRTEVEIRFPLDESKRYVYPELKGGSVSFSLENDTGSWLARLFGAGDGQVKISGSGSGLEIWADVTVRVPADREIVIDHGAGAVEVRDLRGDMDVSVRSGHVAATQVTGAVSIDTGSGHVRVADVRGDLHVDTGSGHVVVEEAESETIHVDTGSGRVELDSIDGATVHVDTGSGRVEGRSVGADELEVDTGSGSVTLELSRMGGGPFRVDTGSGSVDLKLPLDASTEVTADTGSGGIEIDLSGEHRIHRREEDEAWFTVGGGGAKLELDTGSGAIRISQ